MSQHNPERVLIQTFKKRWFPLALFLVLAVLAPTNALSNQQATNAYLPIGANNGLYQGRHAAYTVGVQFVNLENSPAMLQLMAYTADGATAGSGAYPVAANQVVTLFPLQAVTNGFSGALTLTSDKKGAAIANLMSSDFSGGATYVSRSQGATKVSLPLLNVSGGSNSASWYSLQNTGMADAQVQVAYSDGITATATIKPGTARTFYQTQESHTQRVFAGTITSTQPLVAAVVQEVDQIIFAYNGFTTSGAPKLLFPLVNFGSGAPYVTGIQIQNTGDQATDVTVAYRPSTAGSECTEKRTIAAGASVTFALLAFTPNQPGTADNCADGSRFVGSAQVTGNSTNQPLVGIVNQLLPGRNGEAYTAFVPTEATAKVVMPLIMDRNGGFFTGFSVMNVGDATTTVTCTFTNTPYTASATLAPGQALTDVQANKITPRYTGSGTCTAAEESARIVAIVNQLGSSPNADQLLVYEGINQ
ncbi:MAG: hypothetical protein ACOYNY_28355 [Caldilineaceae bacterium]